MLVCMYGLFILAWKGLKKIQCLVCATVGLIEKE